MRKRIKNIFVIAVLVGTVLASSFPSTALNAAELTQTTITLTAQQVNESGNQTIRFQTPSGVDAPADTITVTWPTGFDLTSILLTDMDLSSGPVSGYENEKTLAAAPGINIWGAGIAGQVLTLTPPTNAAPGEIGINDFVIIEVGTHASTGGAGVNQITNPATEGSYVYHFAGGFGDTKAAAVWIATSNDVGVNAIVSGVTPPPPGGGGGDFTPPIISNIQVINITMTSGEVTWDTNEIADSCVEYGLTSSYELGMICNPAYVLSHSIVLPGLTPDTLYHFRVISTDPHSNRAVSGDHTFRTLADDQPPIISNIRVINITTTSAEIVWDTNELATSQVDWGLTSAYGNETPIDFTYVTEHHVILTGLTPDTLYHFRVRSYDMAGNGAVSGDNTFRTLLTVEYPEILDVQIVDITQTSARVIWDTNEPADSAVDYGELVTYEIGTVVDGAYVVSHSLDLTGLTPDTLYHVRVRSSDPEGHETISGDYTFRTLPDTTPPANVTNFTATPGPGPREITLDWTNPTDPDFAGVRICRSTTAYPTDPLTCTVIYEGTGTTFVDTDVILGVRYYYTNFAFDAARNYASGAVADAIILEETVYEIVAWPEKRWPRTGNWGTTADFEIRTPGSIVPLESVTVDTNNEGRGIARITVAEDSQPYDFALKGLSHLRKVIYGQVSFGNTTNSLDFTFGGTFDLYAGDCHPSKDNLVNSLDISTLVNDLSTPERVSDLNADTLVNALDITIQLANLMKYLGDN